VVQWGIGERDRASLQRKGETRGGGNDRNKPDTVLKKGEVKYQEKKMGKKTWGPSGGKKKVFWVQKSASQFEREAGVDGKKVGKQLGR